MVNGAAGVVPYWVMILLFTSISVPKVTLVSSSGPRTATQTAFGQGGDESASHIAESNVRIQINDARIDGSFILVKSEDA